MRLSRLRPTASSLLALILALAALGAPAAPLAQASPGVYNVDRTDDTIVTGCSFITLNDCTLRGAVQNANANPGSTIALSASVIYTLTDLAQGELVLSTTTTLNNSNSVCVIGTCLAIIKGSPSWNTRLLEIVPGAAVTVDHVQFTGGHGANGGALMNSGTLTLTSSQVFSNTSSGWGGGILNFGALTISNTVLNGNRATSNGGAITSQADVNRPGTMTIINSSILTNAVTGVLPGQGIGGGLASFDNISGTIHPALTIINTSILSNTGLNAGANVGLGGGLYLAGQNTLITVTLQNNSANSGGGLDLTSGQLIMQGGAILSNTAIITGSGGGLDINGHATLTNVSLSGNVAGGGGGALIGFGDLTMQGGSVISNTALTAAGSGGGFRNDGLLTLNGVLVSDNQVLAGGSGGAISSASSITITNSTLARNHASGGGAIWLGGSSGLLLLDHTSVLSNTGTYGGAVGGYGAYTITNGSLISGNTGFQGGALNISGGGRAWVGGNSLIANNQTSGGATGESKGGGIFNAGRLQIQAAAVTGNNATNGPGGSLYNAAGGEASLASAALVSNQAGAGPGGGIANLGVLTITASAIVSNSSVAAGGGISNTGLLALLNTTLSGNSAATGGGGLTNDGQAQLSFVTIAHNTGGSAAGGLATSSTLTLSNSLLADNLGTPFDCAGAVTSLGHNLIGHTSGCTLAGPGTGDKLNVVPLITSLIDLGGALRYHDLLPFSPALEAADHAAAACPATDQRGLARPIHLYCDIGAIESSAQAYYYLFLPLLQR